MLEARDTIDWSQVSCEDGPAVHIPAAIQDLISKDAEVRQRGRDTLHISLENQGVVYQAAAYAVPFLLEVLADPQVQEKRELIVLLAFLGSKSTYFAYFGHQFLSLETRLARQRIALR